MSGTSLFGRVSWLKSQAQYWREFESLMQQRISLPKSAVSADSFHGVHTAPVSGRVHPRLCTH